MVDLRAFIVTCLLTLSVSAREPVTDLEVLRALPAEEAAAGVPVRVEGTVVGLEPSAPFHFFLHDGRAGCFIKTRPSGRPAKLAPGDRVRVEGVSDPLGYYPSVKEGRVKILGKSPLPPPVKPSAGEMFSPQLDSQWVEVPAVITGYEVADERITLAVEVHGLPFKAELPVTADAETQAAALMQRPVHLRGVMGTIFNRQRQMTDRHFFVPSFASIIQTAPRENGESYPLLTVSQLLTGLYGPTTLVRLQGTVTQHDPKGFYLRDSSGSTLVQAAKAGHLLPGTRVEAEGFGAVAPFRPVLRATRVTALGESAPIAPVPFDFETGDLSALHAEWVTLDADFLGQRDGPVDGILQFRAGGQFFEALHPNKSHAHLPPLASGDRIRLTGICELTTTHALPRIDWVDGFRIHLPENGGMEVISRAPWWTTRRLLVALGVMSGIAATGFLGTWLLRRQVKSQMHIISDKLRSEAVGEERDRMARELHDTLEQQLSGVALQLDSLDHAVTRNPAAASATLSLARRMLRYTRHEARRSVWDLRSKVLENDGLSAALRAIQETSGGPAGPAIVVDVSGTEHVLSAGVDFHLLRIAQEATTNAIKHGTAATIRIELEYLAEATRLIIRDDGRGFDPAAAQPSPGPHFGLLGMRERAGKIGATLTFDSAPGTGCTVTVTLPHETQSGSPMNTRRIRILVVDDHFMVRLGLIGAISTEPDIEVVGEASSGAEALTLFSKLQPDVTLMDGILPDIHGVEVTRRILDEYPEARIVLVSINDTAEDIHRALQVGAWSYIPKSSEKDAIVRAIRAVAAGERYLPPELSRKLSERNLQPLLSTRETEVLRLIAKGLANKQIASELEVGEATVKSHVAHILDKLGAPDRTRAVTLAMERGLLR